MKKKKKEVLLGQQQLATSLNILQMHCTQNDTLFHQALLGLLSEVLCDIYGVSEPYLFVSVILLKPDLVVLTHSFHSSKSTMIDVH